MTSSMLSIIVSVVRFASGRFWPRAMHSLLTSVFLGITESRTESMTATISLNFLTFRIFRGCCAFNLMPIFESLYIYKSIFCTWVFVFSRGLGVSSSLVSLGFRLFSCPWFLSSLVALGFRLLLWPGYPLRCILIASLTLCPESLSKDLWSFF